VAGSTRGSTHPRSPPPLSRLLECSRAKAAKSAPFRI
jgi:hypothetical protein